MKYGFVRVAAVTPEIRVGSPEFNTIAIIDALKRAEKEGAEIVVMPELCVTGYTAMDLFFTRELQEKTVAAIKIIAMSVPENTIAFIGAPIVQSGRLYNCAVALSAGRVLGIVPKHALPDYGEFYESRYFTPAFDGVETSDALGVPMGDILFKCNGRSELVIGCEICEDMWADVPPSVQACRAGASVIVNLSASDEIVGKAEYRRLLVSAASGKQHCAYVYADAGMGESSTDAVFSAHNIIAENGAVLAESEPFGAGLAVTDIDVERTDTERRKTGMKQADKRFMLVPFELGGEIAGGKLIREVQKYPFVPENDDGARAELILSMQARGLATRMRSTKAQTAVLGLSGGLDSALALAVCCRAVDKENIVAVTMPCFGTTQKTLNNAQALCDALGVELAAVDIKDTVTSHLNDLAHDKTDVVYENAQARTRTMTLFDLSNKTNGIVVGTGDLSELALGWATYNGDHMSSYGVNAGVPKTLVKHLIKYEAERLGGDAKLAFDGILNTDISPELLPPDGEHIAQKTEDILGKYDLLDFIIYYYCRYGFSREKIAFLLDSAFYATPATQKQKALDTFYKRFFVSQFKRSCLPDGVKIGTVSFSPRSDWRLPSDIESN